MSEKKLCGTLMWSHRLNGEHCHYRATVRLTGGLHLNERWTCRVHLPQWLRSGWKVATDDAPSGEPS